MKCQECPKKDECLKFFQKGSNAGIRCKEPKEDEEWSCTQGYGPGRVGPVECEMCDEDDCPSRCARYIGGIDDDDEEDEETCIAGFDVDEVSETECEMCDEDDCPHRCPHRCADYVGYEDDE